MTTHDDFQRQLAENPDDTHTQRVYADFLDERGNPIQAERMRWWADAKDRLRRAPKDNRSIIPADRIPAYERSLPDWVRRAMWGHHLHREGEAMGLGNFTTTGHLAEMHALGVLDPTARADEAARIHASPITTYIPTLASAMHEIFLPPAAGAIHRFSPMPAINGGPDSDHNRFYSNDLHLLVRHALANHPPKDLPNMDTPVRLARPIGWLKDRVASWFAKPDAPRDQRDGILHTHASDPTAAYAERNAVAQALRLSNAPDHMSRVPLYTAAIARFVKEKPDHAVVKNYVDKASVVGGTAGPELTDAVKPLVGVANLLLHAAGKEPRFTKQTTESAAAAHAPPVHVSSAGEEALPAPGEEALPPLTLEPEQEPAEDRHTAVLRLTKGGANREEIVKHLIEAHGAPNRKAALASIRAAYNRAIALHEKSKKRPGPEAPEKLAAYTGGAIGPQHVSGRVAANDPYTGAASGFRPGLEGTALAFHLRQIQQEHPELGPNVEAALTGRAHGRGANADAFASLGTALKQKKHRLAGAYDWSNLSTQLHTDAAVNSFVRRHVQNPQDLAELQYWDRVRKQFGKGTHPQADEFWRRFDKEFGGKISHEDAVQALHRLGERALDRAYLQATKRGEESKRDWRDTMHLSREEDWVSAKIAKLMKEGYEQKQAVAIAYSMWRKRSK